MVPSARWSRAKPPHGAAQGTIGRSGRVSSYERSWIVHAEIVVTGTELLLGEIVDTNSTTMSRMLRDIGLDLYYKSTVGDNQERTAAVLRTALERSDIVLVSGGLGPTVDDVTRQAVSDVTGRPLIFRQDLFDQIAARFARFGRQMTENNRRQAYVPEGAIAIENPVGTAPAFIVEDVRGTIICLPGVPREMEYLMKERVIPYLQERLGQAATIKARILRTCSIGESQIDALIGDLMIGRNPTVGLAAHAGQVDVRITAKAASEAEADQLIAPVEADLRARLGKAIYGEGTETLEEVVARLLAERGMTLALVDNVTEGEVGDRLRSTPNAGVLISEERPVGEDALAASNGTGPAPDHAAEGPRTAAEYLAARARADAGASLGLAVFGVIQQEEDERPLAYLSLSDNAQTITRLFRFFTPRLPLNKEDLQGGGEDKLARRWLSTRALDLVRRYLIQALEEETR
jgi:nicotinamide-nucleotide amidase